MQKMTAMRIGCMGCHQLDNKTVGPAIKAIAKKHKDSNVDELVKTVKTGRQGDALTWGTVAMPASPADQVRLVIEWMLTQ
jgi:cytochrome c